MKLKVRITEFEGSPEEYRGADLHGLFESGRARNGSAKGGELSDTGDALPPHVNDFLENRVPTGEARAVLKEVISSALEWGDVSVKPGGGQSEGKYVRLYRRGSPFGAFAYVHPTYAHVRLTADAAQGMKYAQARNVVSSNPHQLVVPLDDRAALDEALELMRTAYDQVGS